MNYKELKASLLKDPNLLKKKKPFTRGMAEESFATFGPTMVDVGEELDASLPTFKRIVIPQEQFLRELDPYCHDVLFDENLPSICVKIKNGGYRDIKFARMAIPIQKLILLTQLIHLTAYDMQFTMLDKEPTSSQLQDFVTAKQYWEKRNQDGMKNKMVATQMSCGDAGLLYYFDRNGKVKSRILSYADGYVLCPHNDQNGDRILESVYYCKDGVEYIDNYDDLYMYRWKNSYTIENNGLRKDGWVLEEPVLHGFEEIPLITKRGAVPWNEAQPIIESYEELYNVFAAIQKRFGWGIFYVKGKFKNDGKKIAGNVVLNDTTIDGKGDAKFLTPPTPQGTIDTLKTYLSTIQLSSGCTFVLPEDLRLSGDVSGIAVQITKGMDIQTAKQNVIEWQNVADKMWRLFTYGLSKELVNSGVQPNAFTSFKNMNVSAKFKVWKPFNETEFNNMLISMVGGKIISKETATEVNTISKPDEKIRLKKEEAEEIKKQEEMLAKRAMNVLDDSTTIVEKEGGEE